MISTLSFRSVFFLFPTSLLLILLWPAPVMAKTRPPVDVIAAPVTSAELTDSIEALGTSIANEAIILTPKITEKVTEIHFSDGEKVARNQLLVQLNDQEEQANLRAEQAVLQERISALRRAQELYKRKAGSAADLDLAEARVSQTKADIEAIRTRIKAHQLRAPFAGVMGLREVSEGALVEPDDVLTTLDDLSVIKVDFDVPVVYLNQIRTGLKVTASTSAWPKQTFSGELNSIATRIDPVTRTVKVRARFDNKDQRLFPGLLMQLNIKARPRQALTVPESAVFAIARQHFVYVITAGEDDAVAQSKELPELPFAATVKRQEVSIGTRRVGMVEVTSGLQAGDLVISHGGLKVASKGKINVIAVDHGSLDIAAVLNSGKSSSSPEKTAATP